MIIRTYNLYTIHNQYLVVFVFACVTRVCVFLKIKCPENKNVSLLILKKKYEIVQHLCKGLSVIYLENNLKIIYEKPMIHKNKQIQLIFLNNFI